MSSNKKVKEALIRRYGNKCFIERLKLRDTSGARYRGCGQYKRMKMLTYHHIKMKKDGGRATIENGALLSNENHQWFHKQSQEAQEIMNNMFQELKKHIDQQEMVVEKVDDIECPFDIKCAEMWVEGGQVQVKLFDKKQEKIEKDKERRKEKRELQRLRKEWEDR